MGETEPSVQVQVLSLLHFAITTIETMPQVQIDHPSYYQSCIPVTRHIAEKIVGARHLDKECIEVIELYDMPYHSATALAYLWRAGAKADLISDLQKARWFLVRMGEMHRYRGFGLWEDEIQAIDDLIARHSA